MKKDVFHVHRTRLLIVPHVVVCSWNDQYNCPRQYSFRLIGFISRFQERWPLNGNVNHSKSTFFRVRRAKEITLTLVWRLEDYGRKEIKYSYRVNTSLHFIETVK